VSWYISKGNTHGKNSQEDENESDNDMGVSISIDEKSLKKDFCLICEQCFNNKEIPLPRNLKRENFEVSTVYNLFSKEKINHKLIERIKEQKWTPEENKKLMESMKKNNSWDDVVKSLGKNNNKTKKDCILHLMQMPISMINSKDNESDKESNETEKEKEIDEDLNMNEINMKENELNQINNQEEELKEKEKGNDANNNEIKVEEEKKEEEKNEKMNNNMLEIFMRLFKRYLNEKEKDKNEKNLDDNGGVSNKSFKEVIYKTFAKSINKCKQLKNEEKNEMKNIVDILVYLEMRKIELKMNYFRQFERLLEYKKTQLKTIETQIIQERIKLITKKLLLQQKQQQANESK